ncbi:MAG TPA: hypothetical protein VFC51_01815 [Chloroflexota bacterium]|nr:hypothetical protein [Chloroflexota bacterium]
MLKLDKARRLIAAVVVGAGLLSFGAVMAPQASADSCDSTTSIVPADNSFTWAITPICFDDSGTDVVVTVPDGLGGSITIVSNSNNAVVRSGVSGVAYTTPGNTAYVNGQPELGPYTNISTYTPSQAAAARAAGNPSATANAYSQYGGFTPPGDTATRIQSSGTVMNGH